MFSLGENQMVRKSRPPVNTDKQVERLNPEAKKYAVRVKDMTGLYLRARIASSTGWRASRTSSVSEESTTGRT